MHKAQQNIPAFLIRIVVIVYAVVVVTLVLLAVGYYHVQWREEMNSERQRHLAVFAQAFQYYAKDHDNMFPEDVPLQPLILSNTAECEHECPALGATLACYNAERVLVPSYMEKILRDSMIVSNSDSGFYFYRSGEREITFGSCRHFFDKSIILRQSLQ